MNRWTPPTADDPGATDIAAPLDITRLLTTITDNLVGMIYRCRIDAIWTMEYVSEGCHKLTGYRPDELVFNTRVSYGQTTLPEDRERGGLAIHTALENNRAFDVEYRIRRADSRVRWVLERRSADPLGLSRQGPHPARQLHLDRRGNRAHHPHRPVDPCGGLPPEQRLAARRPAAHQHFGEPVADPFE